MLFIPSDPVIHANTDESKPVFDTQIVAVFSTQLVLNHGKPWSSPGFRSVRGSGFFFKDENNYPDHRGLILTNAHVTAMASKLGVSSGKEKRRYRVELLGECHWADFAVLKMPSDELEVYEQRNGKIVPLELGNSDRLRVGDRVSGWGYPFGGERISKSEEGNINRIELGTYEHLKKKWLLIQTSLQMNSGNSGGPIIKDKKVVGIAFQGIRASDRINYFIPINLVKMLLPLLHDQGRIPSWQFKTQKIYPQLRRYFGLSPQDGGLLLSHVIPEGGPHQFGLRSNDILLSMDGHPIDNYGEVFFDPLGQRIEFEEILNRKKVGDPLTIKVMRNGKLLEISGKVIPGVSELIPKTYSKPNFIIYGGIGFIELTQDSIRGLARSGINAWPLKLMYGEAFPERPDQKIVIVVEIFPEYGLVDTEPYLAKRVETLEGEKILNIQDFVKKIQWLRQRGKKRVLLGLSDQLRLPLDLNRASEIDEKIKLNYGILHTITPGGFS
jgi:S1-C subfamily serine protease